jgi:Protein of unknown function (DUF2934)
MFPTEEQVRQAAFDRWRRRGWVHGFDREDWFAAQHELTFSQNYQSIVEYPLDVPGTLILSDRPARYCRFCERTAVHAAFGSARRVVDAGRQTSLYTEAICDDCHSTFRAGLAQEFRQLQDSLPGALSENPSGLRMPGSPHYSINVFKSLIACALTIAPENELRYFVDTLEWVSNPGPDCDAPLLHDDATCLVYSAAFLRDQSWTSLARRVENDAPFPYMLYFLAHGGVVLQVQVPLCIRDQDLDGRPVQIPRRSFMSQEGRPFEQARAWELRLSGPDRDHRGDSTLTPVPS